MKRYLLISLCAMMCAAVSAQSVMVVEKNDNTTTKFNIDDVKRVYFEENGSDQPTPNPSNAVLSCRLKDKYGNPVLLTRSGGDTFEYDEGGKLTYFYSDKTSCSVDGLNIKATDGRNEWDIQLTLNGDGLIAKCSVVERWSYDSGVLATLSQGVYLCTYNDEKQLIRLYCESGYEENYNEDGSVRERNDLAGITRTYPTNTNTGEVNVCRQNTRKDCPFEIVNQGLYEIGLFGVGQPRFNEDVEMTLNENGTIAKEGNRIYEYK